MHGGLLWICRVFAGCGSCFLSIFCFRPTAVFRWTRTDGYDWKKPSESIGLLRLAKIFRPLRTRCGLLSSRWSSPTLSWLWRTRMAVASSIGSRSARAWSSVHGVYRRGLRSADIVLGPGSTSETSSMRRSSCSVCLFSRSSMGAAAGRAWRMTGSETVSADCAGCVRPSPC